MLFTEKLPELHDLCKVAKSVRHYPSNAEEIKAVAEGLKCKRNVIHFINLFCNHPSTIFESRTDFYTRAAELALLICEERIQPQESIFSTQS